MFRVVFTPFLLLLVQAMTVKRAKDAPCETLGSAFTLDGVIYLITDQRVVALDDYEEIPADVDIPVQMPGQTAATELPGGEQYMLISSEASRIYWNNGTLETRTDFQTNASRVVDAATNIDDLIFLFSGSKYQIFNDSKLSSPIQTGDLRNIGLPDDLDAVFFDPSGSAIVAIRGDRAYMIGISDRSDVGSLYFYGPLPYHVFPAVESLNLCPRVD